MAKVELGRKTILIRRDLTLQVGEMTYKAERRLVHESTDWYQKINT